MCVVVYEYSYFNGKALRFEFSFNRVLWTLFFHRDDLTRKKKRVYGVKYN
jgi:hypothetical protein